MSGTVIIAGAGRSGTSMVTRLLNLVGVSLGADERMMPPTSGNPKGYWEHLDFVSLNDRILSSVGAGWDYPPRDDTDWSVVTEDEELRNAADRLVSQFAGADWWGWKDPRTSFTLPFWRTILDAPAVVICLRHPLEVAQSLTARHYLSEAGGLELWLQWNRHVLRESEGLRTVVTHHAAYFAEPAAELTRLVNGLGRAVSREVIDTACGSIDSALRHHETPRETELHHPRADEIRSLYSSMCEQARRHAAAIGSNAS